MVPEYVDLNCGLSHLMLLFSAASTESDELDALNAAALLSMTRI